MSDEEEECPECPAGIPAWVMTFADLMSLLMCFFVLLLAFSEMDAQKYKQVAGSMKFAFGVQNVIKTKDIPKGTSIIAQEFSPGRPEKTPVNEVRQFTTDVTDQNLDLQCDQGNSPINVANEEEFVIIQEQSKAQSEGEATGGAGEGTGAGSDEADAVASSAAALKAAAAKEVAAAKATAGKISKTMYKEIMKGDVEVETRDKLIVVRVRERGAFGPGDDELKSGSRELIQKISDVLAMTPGRISVEGHTDSIPIENDYYRSNWDLSALRAVSIVHALLKNKELNPRNFSAVGRADVVPLVPNDSAANRARNRRVEIVINQGWDLDIGGMRTEQIERKNAADRKRKEEFLQEQAKARRLAEEVQFEEVRVKDGADNPFVEKEIVKEPESTVTEEVLEDPLQPSKNVNEAIMDDSTQHKSSQVPGNSSGNDEVF